MLNLDGTQVTDFSPLRNILGLRIFGKPRPSSIDLAESVNQPQPADSRANNASRDPMTEPLESTDDSDPLQARSYAIQRLELENLRCFARARFGFANHFTVLIGDNGTGKTAILEALTISLGRFLDAFEVEGIPTLGAPDHRQIVTDRSVEYAETVGIRCRGRFADASTYWGQSWVSGIESRGRDAAFEAARHLRRRVLNDDVVLPLIAYHATARRLAEPGIETLDTEARSSRFAGYADCLSPAAAVRRLFILFKSLTLKAYRDGMPPPELIAIRNAISICMQETDADSRGPKWRDVEYDLDHDRLQGRFTDGRVLPFG